MVNEDDVLGIVGKGSGPVCRTKWAKKIRSGLRHYFRDVLSLKRYDLVDVKILDFFFY